MYLLLLIDEESYQFHSDKVLAQKILSVAFLKFISFLFCQNLSNGIHFCCDRDFRGYQQNGASRT